MMAPMGKFKRS